MGAPSPFTAFEIRRCKAAAEAAWRSGAAARGLRALRAHATRCRHARHLLALGAAAHAQRACAQALQRWRAATALVQRVRKGAVLLAVLLAGLSAALPLKSEIELNRMEDFRQPLTLWVLLLMPSGELKSPLLKRLRSFALLKDCMRMFQ
jgi:hypothetical protein